MSTDYDCWIASQDPYYDGYDVELQNLSMTFSKGNSVYRVTGEWNPESQEWVDGSIDELDEDGEVIETVPNHLTAALWTAVETAMRTKSYHDIEKI